MGLLIFCVNRFPGIKSIFFPNSGLRPSRKLCSEGKTARFAHNRRQQAPSQGISFRRLWFKKSTGRIQKTAAQAAYGTLRMRAVAPAYRPTECMMHSPGMPGIPPAEEARPMERTRPETFGFRFDALFLPSSLPASERWQSGRLYLTRNQACPQGYRGFESLPLRQFSRIAAQKTEPHSLRSRLRFVEKQKTAKN
jgi:hypothetical protein